MMTRSFLRSWIICHTFLLFTGSRPVVGSLPALAYSNEERMHTSIKMTEGSPMAEMPTLMRRFMPPEKEATRA